MYYWLQGENACGRAGTKAAMEEVELNQQVASRVKKRKSTKKCVPNCCFRIYLRVEVGSEVFFFLKILAIQQPAPLTLSQGCSSLAHFYRQQALIKFLKGI